MAEQKSQTVENCNLCGRCNLNCPIYVVLLKESAGPRFKAFLVKKKKGKEIFFMCLGCDACVQGCPAQINIDCLEIRRQMLDAGFESSANLVLRQNIKKFGNPFGEAKKGKKIKQYYT